MWQNEACINGEKNEWLGENLPGDDKGNERMSAL